VNTRSNSSSGRDSANRAISPTSSGQRLRTCLSDPTPGRAAMPSGHGRNAGEVIDFCSIKSSSVRGLCSLEGARKIDDIKRHVVVDTLGLLVACWPP
jgi:hypothetical protein